MGLTPFEFGILTDSSDASKPAGSLSLQSGAESQIQWKEWPISDGMCYLRCGQAVNSNNQSGARLKHVLPQMGS